MNVLTISVLDLYLKHATFEVVTAMLMEKKSPFGCYAVSTAVYDVSEERSASIYGV